MKSQSTDCSRNCSCEVQGRILDSSNEQPISFVTVKIQGASKGTYSDRDGYFVIANLCEKEVDLEISHVGYKRIIHHHDIYHPAMQVYLAPEGLQLESVVIEGNVSASGLKAIAESKLSSKKLSQRQSESLGEVLKSISGVSTIKTGQNIVKPVIHGLHSNRVLIINNGLRHENQNWGLEHAPEIDASTAGRISLVKGAATVKYGPEALGGVVLIDPPRLELSSGLKGGVTTTYRSNGRAWDGNLLVQQGGKRYAWMGQISGLYQGDLHAPDYQLTNTGARERSYVVGFMRHWERLDLKVYYNHFDQELGILRGSVTGNLTDLERAMRTEPPDGTLEFSYDINNPRQEVTHDLLKLSGHYNFDDSRVNFQYGFQYNQRKEFDIRRAANNLRPAIDLELTTHSLDASWLHPEFSSWNGEVGIFLQYQDNNNLPGTNTSPFIPNYNNTRIGFYLVESGPWGRSTLEFGLRYDYQHSSVRGREPRSTDIFRNEYDYQNVSGLIGFKTPLSSYLEFTSNLGTAWRPPNISELYSFGKHQFNIDYGLWRYTQDENGNITTETVLTENERPVPSELGFKWLNSLVWKKDKIRAELVTHLNFLKNYIFSKPAGATTTVRGAFPFFIYDQVDALFLGVDADVTWQHHKKLRSDLKLTYLHARDVNSGDFFIGIPANRIGYELTYETTGFGFLDLFEVSLEGDYTFEQHLAPRVVTIGEIIASEEGSMNPFAEDDSNFDFLAPPSGYFLLNAYLRASIKQLSFSLFITNALDRSYRDYTNAIRYFADEVGRNFILSAKFQF